MFEIYKKGQGVAARWIAALGMGALAAFGCYELEEFISGRTWGSRALALGVAEVSVSVLISGAAFITAAILIALAVNQPRFVDYLIASESELRKVSWPTREELKRQTSVVIITLIFFGLLLLVADLIFALGSTKLYGF